MSEELYIRVENGQAVDHPITGWNLRMFYPNLDPNNLPKGFERFTRLPPPELETNQKIDGVVYEKTNYGWQDRYIISDLTEEEKKQLEDLEIVLSQIKSYSNTALKRASKLIESGKLSSDPIEILKYLQKKTG